ncbi:hypothetical protein HAX54_005580 [Datura stramonium]|uniref:Uncharacterized protein n=1 Tax=Datura stramonium TaxID=4076 RepID=A0ABS8WWI2_DATST|nr:hypothetical protein [Datura stramonium]
MKVGQEDNIIMIKNFLQHHKNLKGLRLGDLLHRVGEENGDLNMYVNLLTVAITSNATFLDELLKARSDPDNGDAQGRTPLHIVASKEHEECVMVLLRHGCSIHLQDRDGSTAIQVALEENLEDMVKPLLMNGAEINDRLKYKLSTMNLVDMLQKRKVGNMIMVPDTMDEVAQKWREQEKKHNSKSTRDRMSFRVSIYKGHPVIRRRTHCSEPSRLISLPNSLAELKIIACKFTFM